MDDHTKQQANALYAKMPSAPPPPERDGEVQWADVENSEAWQFCAAIVQLVGAHEAPREPATRRTKASAD